MIPDILCLCIARCSQKKLVFRKKDNNVLEIEKPKHAKNI